MSTDGNDIIMVSCLGFSDNVEGCNEGRFAVHRECTSGTFSDTGTVIEGHRNLQHHMDQTTVSAYVRVGYTRKSDLQQERNRLQVW